MGPLATHRTLTRLALSSIHIFTWLFVFQYFYIVTVSLSGAVASVAMSYALAQATGVLLTPLAARRLRRGVRGMLVNALLALAAAFGVLALAFSGLLGSIGLGIALFAVCMGIYRALYWIPYEVAARGHGRSPYIDFLIALAPAFFGVYIASAAYAPLIALCAASVLCLAAIYPLYSMRNTHEGFSWGYRQTFHHLFERRYRTPLVQAVFNGFEGAALLLLWPIAMFVLLQWSYASLGIVLTITFLCTLVVRSLLSKGTRRLESPIVHSVLTASGWMLRGTVAAPVSIVLVDTYFQSGSGVHSRGVDLLTAEQSADSNSYVDEFTALKEMGQGLGRIVFCIVAIVLASFTTFAVLSISLFSIAAILAVSSITLSRRAVRHAI